MIPHLLSCPYPFGPSLSALVVAWMWRLPREWWGVA